MKTGVRRIVEEEPSSSTLSALLSESFVAPLKTRVYRSSSPPTDVIENRSSSSGKLDTVDQSTSPSTPTIGIKLQWPFGSLPWGQVPIESPSPLPLPSVNANLKNAEPLLSLDSMKTAHDNCNKENVNNDEYGKSSLNDLDTMQSGPSDASRHAAVSATITDSIRQLLLEASVSDSSASTSSPGTVQRSKLVLPQNEVFMSEGVLRLLKSVEKLSKSHTSSL